MKKVFFKFICTGVLLCGSLNAAGGIRDVGNGGVGVYCKDAKDPSDRVQLFDLWEGSILQKNYPLPTELDFKSYALSYASYLDNIIADSVSFRSRIQKVIDMMQFVAPDQRLTDTQDLGNFIEPKNCDIVQILNYRPGDARVWIDGEYWNQLTNVHQAAAVLHEVIYAYARERSEISSVGDGDLNSVRTRQIVSLLMAGQLLEKVDDSAALPPGADIMSCSTVSARFAGRPTTDFRVYTYPHGWSHITFNRIAGQIMLTSSTTDFAGTISSKAVDAHPTSLIDWGIRIQMLPMNQNGEIKMYITDGNIRTTEVVNCVKGNKFP